MNNDAESVLDFWLTEVGEKGWYRRDDTVDEACRTRFQSLWERAEEVAPAWAQNARGTLAAVILTDQLPRNIFREDARSFATDALSRRIADQAMARGFDQDIPEPQRQFFYLPFEHSEDMADQDRAVALFEATDLPENLRHARLHRDVIAAFGRFPWRNAVLGRVTTHEEQAFLDAGGYAGFFTGAVSLDAPSRMV